MCSPCGPMVCYKYEDCGPPLGCLPRSAFKRNGIQDHQYMQQGSVRYLCRAGCCQPCPPRCPPCVRRPPPGKTYRGKNSSDRAEAEEENRGEKKGEKENQLRRIKSRELRGGIMYTGCHCIKRNGLQHDCRRTGCQGEPTCLVLPDPMCAPSQLARARGLADPGPLAAHLASAAGGRGVTGGAGSGARAGGGKRFIVCELTGALPISGSEAKTPAGKCCECPPPKLSCPLPSPKVAAANAATEKKCCCPPPAPVTTPCCACKRPTPTAGRGLCAASFDQKFVEEIIRQIQESEESKAGTQAAQQAGGGGGGGGRRRAKRAAPEPCTRAGCLHWTPPPACVWPAPCLADCFEAHAGVGPGGTVPAPGLAARSGGVSGAAATALGSPPAAAASKSPARQYKMHLLLPTGCGGGAGGANNNAAAALPMLLMKLC